MTTGEEAGLRAEVLALFPHTDERHIQRLIKSGWTGPQVRRLRTLGEWALVQGTGIALNPGSGLPVGQRISISGVVHALMYKFRARLVEADNRTFLPDEQAWPWLERVVADPDPHIDIAMRSLLTGFSPRQEYQGWIALGPVGPLAHAAGFSLEEAQAEAAAGRLDGEPLRALLALRGFVFPPAGLFPSEPAAH